ncbi:hypothetical protein [Microbaculum marinum]|uniref:LPXTG cell wall anchor domain-containing protein n=1 Tax=Microbaculum marinum TaxID=1764581 RepID=A0AAW9S1Y9_9HYPH
MSANWIPIGAGVMALLLMAVVVWHAVKTARRKPKEQNPVKNP